MCEWTPPYETSPSRWRSPRRSRARWIADTSAGFSKNEPSAIARFTRIEVLEEDAPGADRQVADLGVPHLARRQADGLARGRELGVRIALPEGVEDGRVRELDRVARPRRREPPAVEDDEDDELRHACTACAPARQIASNDAASSDAPPTSAPSTSGCARSTAAFSGFTEPP